MQQMVFLPVIDLPKSLPYSIVTRSVAQPEFQQLTSPLRRWQKQFPDYSGYIGIVHLPVPLSSLWPILHQLASVKIKSW